MKPITIGELKNICRNRSSCDSCPLIHTNGLCFLKSFENPDE